jgi:hypothetical protein
LRVLLSPEKSHSATLNPLDVFSCFLSGKHANVKLAFFFKKKCVSPEVEKSKNQEFAAANAEKSSILLSLNAVLNPILKNTSFNSKMQLSCTRQTSKVKKSLRRLILPYWLFWRKHHCNISFCYRTS